MCCKRFMICSSIPVGSPIIKVQCPIDCLPVRWDVLDADFSSKPKLDDGCPESEKHVLQAALSMVVVKNSRWMVGEFAMSYGGESCEITHRRFYTQTLSQTRLHTETFTHRRFYTQTLSHADALTQKLLHTDSFTHRRFHRRVYTQRLLHTDAFTHRHFYTQTLLHTEAFTRRCFYTQLLLHTDTFTHKRFYTQTLLHADPFTHRRFYTQRRLHADAFTHTHTFIHRGFYTQKLLKSVSIWHFMVLNSNCSVFDIKHMMASSSVANVCRHFTSEVLSHVSFTASWYRSFLGQLCGIFHNKMK